MNTYKTEVRERFYKLHGKPLADYLAMMDYRASHTEAYRDNESASLGLDKPSGKKSREFGKERMDKVWLFLDSLIDELEAKTREDIISWLRNLELDDGYSGHWQNGYYQARAHFIDHLRSLNSPTQ